MLRLRRLEPDFEFEPRTPKKKPDPEKDPKNWSFEQLLTALGSSPTLELARALDSWPHARLDNVGWLPALLECMKNADPELDRPMAGVIGKMICSDDIQLKRAVLEFGQRNAFHPHGTEGLLFSLSLGDALTVKLLLEVADHAAKLGAEQYSQQALIGVQTAIGRERLRRLDCVRVLLYRFLENSRPVQEFVARFLRNHFDVGYTDHLPEVLELMEDCVDEQELWEMLAKAVQKCGRPKNSEDLALRLDMLTWISSEQTQTKALQTISPPYPCSQQDIAAAADGLRAFIEHPEAQRSLKKFIWEGETPHPIFRDPSWPPSIAAELERRG